MPEAETSRPSTDQQLEALEYFRKFAGAWHDAAAIGSDETVNVAAQRNAYVLDVVQSRAETRDLLDVGCGTGELVLEIARRGIDATGIDFAREMVQIASAKAKDADLSRAHFTCASIFDVALADDAHDVISANGFIEYISHEQLRRLLSAAFAALRSGGSLIVGSRNRLFNVFSLGSYARDELDSGTVPLLLREAIAIGGGASVTDLLALETVPVESADRRHAHTGIGVSTRFQYTPAQLAQLIAAAGFIPEHVSPIHVHGVIPAFKDAHPTVHASISKLLQRYAAEAPALIPTASSFMVRARKQHSRT